MGFNRAGDSGFGLFPNVCHVQINNQACSTAGRALPRYTSRPDVACNVIVKGISIEHTRRRRHPPSLSHLPLSLADACWARACAATFSLQSQPSSLPAPLTDSLVVFDIRWDAAISIPFDLSEGDFKTAKFRSVFTCWQSICEYIRRKSGYEIKVKFITLIIMSWKVTEDLSPITSKFIKYLVPFLF